MSEYVGCNGKNVNENKFAAKKKLTKHKTNFSGAREKGDMLVYPLWMMAQQQRQHSKQEKGGGVGAREAVAAHFYPKRARTHNQHGRSCRAAGAAAAAAPHGIVEVVSGAAGWRPFGQALAQPCPLPRLPRNKIKMSKTNLRDIKRICIYVCMSGRVCVSVRGANAKNGNAKFLAENSQSPEHARGRSCL